jgi:hypothetical protein
MSLAEKWSVSTFYYDKGFFEGARHILSLQLQARPLCEIQSLVSTLESKFRELEEVHTLIIAKLEQQKKTEEKKRVVVTKDIKKKK